MQIDFWYEFASTYSYPAAMRVDELAAQSSVTVNWRPFMLGPIFAEQGWRDSPFNIYPAKGQYMWRDMERICNTTNLPFNRPKTFPQSSLKAARIALVGEKDGWIAPFSKAVYRANFVDGSDISDPETLAGIINSIGLDAEGILAESNKDHIKSALRAQTDEAKERGIFGAPSFIVGDELFWGNDRLESAIDWASRN